MSGVERDGEGFVVDADLVAGLLKIGTDALREGMRSGAITSRCEVGEGDDAGLWRLTFQSGSTACRLIVDDAGKTLKTSCWPVGKRPEAPPRGA